LVDGARMPRVTLQVTYYHRQYQLKEIMEILHKIKVHIQVPAAALIIFVLFFTACKPKTHIEPVSKDPALDTLNFDGKNAASVRIKHGDSINVVLKYDGPNVLTDIAYNTHSNNNFNIFFGEGSEVFPEVVMLPLSKFNSRIKAYRFHNTNGILHEIRQSLDSGYDGPYYLFDENGILTVSGFYKKNDYSGIWRHYDSKGNILETIDASKSKIDILKHWKFE